MGPGNFTEIAKGLVRLNRQAVLKTGVVRKRPFADNKAVLSALKSSLVAAGFFLLPAKLEDGTSNPAILKLGRRFGRKPLVYLLTTGRRHFSRAHFLK